jgi:hypothetical protein
MGLLLTKRGVTSIKEKATGPVQGYRRKQTRNNPGRPVRTGADDWVTWATR